MLLEISSSLIHQSFEANSCSENLKNCGFPEAERGSQEMTPSNLFDRAVAWISATCQCQRQVTVPLVQPCFLFPVCTCSASKSVMKVWLGSLNAATVINTCGSLRKVRRRLTPSPTDSIPEKLSSSSKLSSVFCWTNRHLCSGQSPSDGSTVQGTNTASICPGVSIEIM